MKTSRVLVLALVLVLGILATAARAQSTTTSSSTPGTNGPFTNPPVPNPINPNEGGSNAPIPSAPSTVATNSFFGRSFQSTTGVQTATMTNVPLGIPSQTTPGAPSTVTTNPFFGSAFQGTTGAQATTAIPTNLLPANTPQSVVGAQPTAATTNFFFVSSIQSSVGQGQSLFAAATNGYNVSLLQISSNILQFNITSTNSVNTNWTLQFSCTNDVFTVGTWSNALNAGGSPASFVFSGMGRAANTANGFFKVLEATYSSNQLVSFAADFVQYDNDDTNGWNEGSIRYNSTIPDTVNLFMAPVAISIQDGNAILTWSTNLVGFQLEYATNVPPRTWFTNNSVPSIVDGRYTVTVTNGVSPGPHLYRLMKPL